MKNSKPKISKESAIDLTKTLEKSDMINTPEELQEAIETGETVLGCTFAIDGLSINYIYLKEGEIFYALYPTTDFEVNLWLAEQYSPMHIAVAWHTNEYLFRDNAGVVDLKKVKWDAAQYDSQQAQGA